MSWTQASSDHLHFSNISIVFFPCFCAFYFLSTDAHTQQSLNPWRIYRQQGRRVSHVNGITCGDIFLIRLNWRKTLRTYLISESWKIKWRDPDRIPPSRLSLQRALGKSLSSLWMTGINLVYKLFEGTFAGSIKNLKYVDSFYCQVTSFLGIYPKQ